VTKIVYIVPLIAALVGVTTLQVEAYEDPYTFGYKYALKVGTSDAPNNWDVSQVCHEPNG
jgi:hypothetical protein